MASQVYFESDAGGDWYQCIAATAAGESPATHPTKWRRIDLPWFLGPVLSELASSYLQNGEGQSDKALATRRSVEGQMERLILRHADLGNITQLNVFTR